MGPCPNWSEGTWRLKETGNWTDRPIIMIEYTNHAKKAVNRFVAKGNNGNGDDLRLLWFFRSITRGKNGKYVT